MNNYQEKMEKVYYYAEAWETSIGEVMLELLMQHFIAAGYERNALLDELFSKSDEELMYPTYKVIVDDLFFIEHFFRIA